MKNTKIETVYLVVHSTVPYQGSAKVETIMALHRTPASAQIKCNEWNAELGGGCSVTSRQLED